MKRATDEQQGHGRNLKKQSLQKYGNVKKIIIKKKTKSKESPSLFSPSCFPLSPQTPP